MEFRVKDTRKNTLCCWDHCSEWKMVVRKRKRVRGGDVVGSAKVVCDGDEKGREIFNSLQDEEG